MTQGAIRARDFTGSPTALVFGKMPVLQNLEFRDKASLRCDPIRKSKEYSNACAAYIVGVVARDEPTSLHDYNGRQHKGEVNKFEEQFAVHRLRSRVSLVSEVQSEGLGLCIGGEWW